MNIPFNKIYLNGKEKKYIDDALKRGHLSGDGFYTQLVESFFEEKFSLNKVFMTTSGTHALEMAAQLIDLKQEDEVIMPSFTFTSTANSVLLRGAKVVFAEIKADTLNLNPAQIEKRITKNTKAIIVVHYAGVGCDMEEIMKIADKYNIYVIEDAAHAVNAEYKNEYLGGIGDFGCYSFHSTKNYTSGEGGALIINNRDSNLIEKAETIREKGTNRSDFLRGNIDKYTWVNKGSSYLPSDLLMALLYAQLEDLDLINELRKNIYEYYSENLRKYLAQDYLEAVSFIPPHRKSNYHIFYLRFSNKNIRDYVLNELKEKGIQTSFHYVPLHSSPMGNELKYKYTDFPVTNNCAETILRLPIYPDLKKSEMKYIINNIEKTFKKL
jgi:dTDP-4-amino-4,6-dideoxygalactose transaminase